MRISKSVNLGGLVAGSEGMGSVKGDVGDARLRYMPHLDGLRAVAVVGVLLYHFDLLRFGGGFAGVDVFFVLSGFLISTLIARDVEAGTFSMWSFYRRRFWRLYPSALVTVAWTLLAAYYIFPNDLAKATASSALASMVSVSNILFMRQAGYYDASSQLKPLLHTWSLSVEEQFYLFWPVVLCYVLRTKLKSESPGTSQPDELVNDARSRKSPRSPQFQIRLLSGAAVGIAAFLAGCLLLESHPASVFYLLVPVRAFQFGLGYGATFAYEHVSAGRLRHVPLLEDTVATLGLATMVTFFRFGTDSYFPGLKVLVPSLATVAVIVTPHAALNQKILAHPVCRYIGKISYALYLVHWPLWVFAKYVNGAMQTIAGSGLPKLSVSLFVLVGTAALGVVQHKYIEEPCRRAKGRPALWGIGMAACVCLVSLCGLTGVRTGGWRYRDVIDFDRPKIVEERSRPCTLFREKTSQEADALLMCTVGNPAHPRRALLLGDSLLISLLPGFDVIAKRHQVSFDAHLKPGCKPFFRNQTRSTCNEAVAIAKDWFKAQTPGDVLITARWNSAPELRDGLRPTIEFLRSLKHRPIVIGRPPGTHLTPFKCLTRTPLLRSLTKLECPSTEVTVARVRQNNAEKGFAERLNLTYVDLFPALLSKRHPGDAHEYYVHKDGKLIYYDDHHLTADGGIFVSPSLEKALWPDRPGH